MVSFSIGSSGAEVARPVDLPVDDAPVARNQADEARVLALVHVALQHGVQALQPVGREPFGFRCRRRQRLRAGGRGQQEEGDQGGKTVSGSAWRAILSGNL